MPVAFPSKAAVTHRRSEPDAGTGYWRLLGRCFKLGMIAILVFISLRAITSEQGYIGTNNAVLSSQITILQAPIEGYVTAGVTTPPAKILTLPLTAPPL